MPALLETTIEPAGTHRTAAIPADTPSLSLLRLSTNIVCVGQLLLGFAWPALFGSQGATITQRVLDRYGSAPVASAALFGAITMALSIRMRGLRVVAGTLYALSMSLAGCVICHYSTPSGLQYLVVYPMLGIALAASGAKDGR